VAFLIASSASLSTPLQGSRTSADNAKPILFGDLGQIKTALVGGIRDVSREFACNLGLVSYKVEVRGATGSRPG